jgi:hypothetical protein
MYLYDNVLTGLSEGIGLSSRRLPVRFTQSSCNLQVVTLGFCFNSSLPAANAGLWISKLLAKGKSIPRAGRFCEYEG